MIVYSGIKRDFLTAVEQDSIAAEIEENIYETKAYLLKLNGKLLRIYV